MYVHTHTRSIKSWARRPAQIVRGEFRRTNRSIGSDKSRNTLP